MAKSSTLWNPLIFFILNPTVSQENIFFDEKENFLLKVLDEQRYRISFVTKATEDLRSCHKLKFSYSISLQPDCVLTVHTDIS